jgi:hypothetical protein
MVAPFALKSRSLYHVQRVFYVRRRPPPAIVRTRGVCLLSPSGFTKAIMNKDALTQWALANGWQMIAGAPSLTKPSSPNEAIVRLVFKTTLVNLEIKKPAGKWEKISGAPYAKIEADAETGFPRGLGLDTISGFAMLMEDNKNRMVFAKLGGLSKPPRR